MKNTLLLLLLFAFAFSVNAQSTIVEQETKPKLQTNCSSCNGRGSTKESDVRCTRCYATGNATCYLCNGSGKEHTNRNGEELIRLCGACGGSGLQTCTSCSGSGYIRSRNYTTCRSCSGMGYRPE